MLWFWISFKKIFDSISLNELFQNFIQKIECFELYSNISLKWNEKFKWFGIVWPKDILKLDEKPSNWNVVQQKYWFWILFLIWDLKLDKKWNRFQTI